MSPRTDMAQHSARILIVDDERQNRQLLEVMLAEDGFVLTLAASGDEALAIVAQKPPDLILLDVMMPGMDGYQVTARIKGNVATKSIPIIMVTALDDRNARMLGLNAGAEDFLSKPVDRAELRVRVRNLLRLKAYGDYLDNYGQMLEGEVGLRTADLVKSEARYRRIIETTNEGVWLIDAEGKTSFMNARMAGMLGCNEDEVVGGSPNEFLDADAVASLTPSLERFKDGHSNQVEIQFRRRNGSTLWALVESTPIVDATGRFEGVLGMVMDITERRKAEADLGESERLYRSTFEAAPVGIVHVGLTGQWLRVNQCLCDLLGYSRAELESVAVQELVRAEPVAGEGEALRRMATGTLDRYVIAEKRYRRRNGTFAWVRINMSVHRDAEGHAHHFIWVIEDVTERRAIDAHLQQASKLDAIGGLAAGVAHDFNNLMSVVLSYSELLADDLKQGDPMRDDLDQIRIAGRRAVDLTRQLLAFSRQQVLQPKVVDFAEIVGGMEKMLRRLIGEDVVLTTTGVPVLGRILVDPGQMEQVIMNLAVNARDAMPTGGKLTIETTDVVLNETYASEHVGVKTGAHVMLAVSDTGTGMNEATMARIFEPFFTTKENGKGTGLGLATVFGIVRQSGGSIDVDSEPGKGTTFKVYFPTTDRSVIARGSTPPSDRRTLRGSETILVVEDEEHVRTLARTILRKYGYNVLEAQNGGDAFLLCEQHEGIIHLLLTDVVMPRMSGEQLAKRLLALRPEMKVLYMSGYTDDAVMRHGIVESTLAFMQKPITPETLARKVREVLGAPRASIAAET